MSSIQKGYKLVPVELLDRLSALWTDGAENDGSSRFGWLPHVTETVRDLKALASTTPTQLIYDEAAERDVFLKEMAGDNYLFAPYYKDCIGRILSGSANRENCEAALQQRLTAADERLDAGISFVTRMIKCAGGQPSIATSYLRDILDKLKPAEGGGDGL